MCDQVYASLFGFLCVDTTLLSIFHSWFQ